MIKWGKKSKPQKYVDQNLTPKKSLAEFPSHKKFPESFKWSNYHESSDCFEYPKKCLPKSSCPKFSYPKKSRNRNFQIQKESFYHLCYLKSGVSPPLMGALDHSGERFKKSEVSVSVLTGFTSTEDWFVGKNVVSDISGLVWIGARFSKGPETFRSRRQISKSKPFE